MISAENEYYLRVYLLLFEGSSYITKEIIRRELPKYGGDLDALLKLKKESKLRHEFHKKQMEKLFPNGGYDKTNINTWDMQMLVGVILIIFQPTLSTREKEKLKEIKDTRNTLAHGSAVELNRKKYDEKKHQIQVAIEELASGFNDAVKTKCRKFISTYIFDPLDVSSAIKRLQELRSTDDKFQELLDLTAKSQNVIQKGISGVESNIRKDLKDLDERIKKVDEKTLQGLNELIKEVKELREQANKQKVYKDEYTQTANTESKLLSL
ncbi:uncharacterized protein LOC128558780 isoform X2 [Mercenaria mercenaria]|uniref:uncharacterized protein LOC128558780 isoform X2 n=1 Tax=Mercenaria mercenaria TaxID=6596 RepID=UPI00234F7E58|nr:uncharacterized protein LOC128558780 isoform X2 [Mercenaria mercenaria]